MSGAGGASLGLDILTVVLCILSRLPLLGRKLGVSVAHWCMGPVITFYLRQSTQVNGSEFCSTFSTLHLALYIFYMVGTWNIMQFPFSVNPVSHV